MFLVLVIALLKQDGTSGHCNIRNPRYIILRSSGRLNKSNHFINFFGAQFGLDSNNYYGFTYHIERTPKQWLDKYPTDFIIVGDSIVKKANEDTFLVIRNTKVWKYILPNETTGIK